MQVLRLTTPNLRPGTEKRSGPRSLLMNKDFMQRWGRVESRAPWLVCGVAFRGVGLVFALR